jgi:hypothetical protein
MLPNNIAMSAERSSRKPDSQPYEKATTWSPTPGEVLRGTLEHAAERQTRYGPCTVANVRCEDSNTLYGVWLSHTVFASKWEETSPGGWRSRRHQLRREGGGRPLPLPRLHLGSPPRWGNPAFGISRAGPG